MKNEAIGSMNVLSAGKRRNQSKKKGINQEKSPNM
jgi:hypothetical protein